MLLNLIKIVKLNLTESPKWMTSSNAIFLVIDGRWRV